MNNRDLEKLLDEKRDSLPVFAKSPDEFAAEFLRRARAISTPPRRRRYHFLAWAAVLLLMVGVAGVFLPGERVEQTVDSAKNECLKLTESVRLFGNRAAIFFFGDELLTGDREPASGPMNFIDIDLDGKNGPIRLSLACYDNDSIRLNSGTAAGTVLVSRTDTGTLVVDLELCHDGERIRTVVPVEKRNDQYYYGSMEV